MTTNPNTPQNVVADIATQATEATQAVLNTWTEAAAKTTAELKNSMAFNQKILKDSLQMWQEYTQGYVNFLVGATQQTMTQSLSLREQLDNIMMETLQKVQELSTEEQKFAFRTGNILQAQAQAAAQYAANLFTATSKVMTTTALFSDWASERVVKTFTTISTN